jgi:1,4-alpha-glucan branching enzyme
LKKRREAWKNFQRWEHVPGHAFQPACIQTNRWQFQKTMLGVSLQGYEKLGFSCEGSTIVYREWAPAAASAQLIGDFNNWNGSWMERDEFGVFKITLPSGLLPGLSVSLAVIEIAPQP